MVIKLELCIIVQLLHIITTRFWFDNKEKERKKNKKICNSSNTNNHNTINNHMKRCKNGTNINIVLQCALKAHYTIVVSGGTVRIVWDCAPGAEKAAPLDTI